MEQRFILEEDGNAVTNASTGTSERQAYKRPSASVVGRSLTSQPRCGVVMTLLAKEGESFVAPLTIGLAKGTAMGG